MTDSEDGGDKEERGTKVEELESDDEEFVEGLAYWINLQEAEAGGTVKQSKGAKTQTVPTHVAK